MCWNLKNMNSRKVLLIDDSADDAFLMKRALSKINPEIPFEWIEDAEEGLARLEDYDGSQNDVIFMDIKMPKLTGLEILEKLQNREKLSTLCRVYILSSSVLQQDIDTAQQYDNVVYFTKPSSYTDLRKLINSVLEGTTKDKVIK